MHLSHGGRGPMGREVSGLRCILSSLAGGQGYVAKRWCVPSIGFLPISHQVLGLSVSGGGATLCSAARRGIPYLSLYHSQVVEDAIDAGVPGLQPLPLQCQHGGQGSSGMPALPCKVFGKFCRSASRACMLQLR